MNNKILDFLQNEILSTVRTTKDLIYKEKIIDAHSIEEDYLKLSNDKESGFLSSKIAFDDHIYFIDKKSFAPIHDFHSEISNDAYDTISKTNADMQKMKNNFKTSEIFNSLWIEGIHSSKRKIKQLQKDFHYSKSDGDFSNKFASNYLQALEFVFTTNEFSEITFFTLYNILSKDIDMGEEKLDGMPYRQSDVQIGTETNMGIESSKIKKSMDTMFELVKEFDNDDSDKYSPSLKIINILLFHYHFELIHPYYDMNGRMVRLLCIWLAKKWNLTSHIIFLSEAINFFKEPLYYSAFEKSKEKTFKFDATYFISSLSSAMIAQKIMHLIIFDLNENFKSTSGSKFNKFQKDIIKSLLAKDIKFYKSREFIIGYDDMNQATVSESLSLLVKQGILESTNTKPKQYRIIWSDLMEKRLGIYKNMWKHNSKK